MENLSFLIGLKLEFPFRAKRCKRSEDPGRKSEPPWKLFDVAIHQHVLILSPASFYLLNAHRTRLKCLIVSFLRLVLRKPT
jgi:hypothetical protein